ncbi:ABC transporter permease [Granulicatella adiacens]|uniref:ABC transporter permease n=1 Tax=Granulicatella adiacens TaxID=46124 RepID=UPI00241C6B4C|nr:ABC transporter permease [Granulicatella adiacens]
MKIAWNEIKYQPKKFILIEVLIVIMMFMVIFLSGLTNGLGRIIMAQIDTFGDVQYILSKDSEGVIPYSTLTSSELTEIEDLHLEEQTGLVIQRSTFMKEDEEGSQDVTFFAMDTYKNLTIKAEDGYVAANLSDNEVILDESYKAKGIHVGDTIKDKTSDILLKVVAFAKDSKYGHSTVAFISSKTLEEMRQKKNPNYTWQPQVIITSQEVEADDLSEQLMVSNKQQIINKIPGYTATNMILKTMTWVLLIASAAILGVFFYILALQKLKQFGVLKAIGMSMGEITRIQLSQVGILSIIGIGIGLGLALALTPFLPVSMPFYMKAEDNAVISVSFIIISIICGALSLLKIKKVDPIEVIGGNGE